MSLTQLTWSFTAFASIGQTAPTDAQVINALIANASSLLTTWRVISSLADTYIEFGGPIGSVQEDMRVIVSVNPGANADLAPDTQSAGIWYTFAPDGGTLGTWNSATPYGSDRCPLYWKLCATAKAESFYFMECEEGLGIYFRDDSTDDLYGGKVGAIFDPLDFHSEADGRLYGMITNGNRVIHSEFWNSSTEFMAHSNSNGYAHVGCFNPQSPTQWIRLNRVDGKQITNTNTLKGANNKELRIVPVYQNYASPFQCIGIARDMYRICDRQNRTTITDVGVTFGASSTLYQDTILYTNQ